MPATGGLALAAAQWVVDRVHRDTAGLRADALPAVATGLPDLGQLVFLVANLADRGTAVDADSPHLRAGQAQGGEVALLGDQLDAGTGATGDLAAPAGLHLDVVDHGADRDVAQRQGVARPDLAAMAGLQRLSHLHALRGEDVALLAVVVVEEQDPATAVRVVLEGSHLGRHAVLIAPEVDHPVLALVAATAVARRLAAVVVATTGAGLLLGQGPLRRGLRDVREVGDGLEPAAGTGRLALALRHGSRPRTTRSTHPRRG